jgi:hypothetical protein
MPGLLWLSLSLSILFWMAYIAQKLFTPFESLNIFLLITYKVLFNDFVVFCYLFVYIFCCSYFTLFVLFPRTTGPLPFMEPMNTWFSSFEHLMGMALVGYHFSISLDPKQFESMSYLQAVDFAVFYIGYYFYVLLALVLLMNLLVAMLSFTFVETRLESALQNRTAFAKFVLQLELQAEALGMDVQAGEPRADGSRVFDFRAIQCFSSKSRGIDNDGFETRPLAKLAWACAAVEYSPTEAFASGLAERFESMSWEIHRDREELRQLHQWQLWFVEQQRAAPFSPHLSALCLDSFVLGASEHGTLIPGGTRVTRFQRQVTDGLAALGLRPEPEVVTSSGYTLDALVHWKGERVGVEADGPHHFRARTHVPTASTQLKRRQVRALGEMLCPIPWWEWNACGSDVQQQGEYLRAALDRTVAEAGARRVVPKWPWATKECG